jgi:deazaflavin-dependent oxidoreductase (nitroreductase family)
VRIAIHVSHKTSDHRPSRNVSGTVLGDRDPPHRDFFPKQNELTGNGGRGPFAALDLDYATGMRSPTSEALMAKYVPSPRDWVREQVELYESSGGTRGTTLRDTGLPVVIVTHQGSKTGAIRTTPLMRVKEGDHYILVGPQGGAPKDAACVHNLRADPRIELRDETIVRPIRVREVKEAAERARLWILAVAAYPPYAEYQARTQRQIPVFVAEPQSRDVGKAEVPCRQ